MSVARVYTQKNTGRGKQPRVCEKCGTAIAVGEQRPGVIGCIWCGHPRRTHTGSPPQDVREALKAGGAVVKWSTTACSVEHCACRRYEK